jgi:mannose-1-phosphate guanylyltransferase
MKAFLLAAGLGTRLRPLTDQTPKCLLPVGGTPLLSIWVRALAGIGVSDILVNTHHLAGQVERWARDWSYPRITLVHEESLLGSGGTLRANSDFMAGEESFVIVYADMLVQTDLRRLLDCHAAHRAPLTIGVYKVEFPRESGIVVFDADGTVTDFQEKPPEPKSEWANSGIFAARPALLSWLPNTEFSDLSIDVLPSMVGRMKACPLDGVFKDIGTPDRYAAANSLMGRDRALL